jgi:hypothetical protein
MFITRGSFNVSFRFQLQVTLAVATEYCLKSLAYGLAALQIPGGVCARLTDESQEPRPPIHLRYVSAVRHGNEI